MSKKYIKLSKMFKKNDKLFVEWESCDGHFNSGKLNLIWLKYFLMINIMIFKRMMSLFTEDEMGFCSVSGTATKEGRIYCRNDKILNTFHISLKNCCEGIHLSYIFMRLLNYYSMITQCCSIKLFYHFIQFPYNFLITSVY